MHFLQKREFKMAICNIKHYVRFSEQRAAIYFGVVTYKTIATRMYSKNVQNKNIVVYIKF